MSKYIAHYGVKGMKWKKRGNLSNNNDVEVNEIQIHHAPGSKPTTGFTKIKECARNIKRQALIDKKIKKRKEYLKKMKERLNRKEISKEQYEKIKRTIKRAIRELKGSRKTTVEVFSQGGDD